MNNTKSKRSLVWKQLTNDSFPWRSPESDSIFLRLSRQKPEEFHFLDKILGECLDKAFQILPADDVPVNIKRFQMLEVIDNLVIQLLLHNK